MIWKQDQSLEFMNRFQKNSLAGHLGIDLVEIGADFLVATMPVDQRTKQPLGLLHGGASAALIESLGGMAGWLCLNDPNSSSVVGIEINANHLRSAKKGMVIGIVRPVKVGRRMQVWTVDIKQGEKLLCTGRLTNMVVRK
ncbi:MAG: hotdog fold thioesterase [Saprospiraceae bacterium]|nr:hotdog fold thioesterase [Saprospiraceae bacterium]